VRRDAMEGVSGEDRGAVDRVIRKLYHNRNEEELGEYLDIFWTEWNEFQTKTGKAFGPARKYIWNSELLRRRECAKWHAQYSVPFTKVSLAWSSCRVCPSKSTPLTFVLLLLLLSHTTGIW
jgi:hypothetical protein